MVLDRRTTKNAVYLIDDKYCCSPKNNVPSGWDYDHRGSANAKIHERNAAHSFTASSEGKYPMTLARPFTVLDKGKASFVHTVQLKSGDGYFIELYSTDNSVSVNITQKDGMFTFNGEVVPCPALNKTYTVALELDLDTKSTLLVINGTLYGTYSLMGADLYKVKTGYKAGSVGSCNMVYTGLWINYLVCDRNVIRADRDMPYGWIDGCMEGSSASSTYYYEGDGLYFYQLCSSGGKTAKVSRSFDATGGVVCFDVKYLTKNPCGENVKLSLTKDGVECVSVLDDGSKSLCLTKNTLRNHNPYVWQRVRIDADTSSGKALVWHNGKKCGYIDFDAKTDSFDGISICYSPDKGGVMKFTDVFVYEIQPEPEDYPKPPVLPTRKKDVYTGMNICSLWREGSHYGWENIVNFPENMPILGPYDEGLPEVADWEIKYMLEHGLDCQFYCWYGNQSGAPFVKTNLSDAMENGHFYAKYGDMMSFALIWEASNSKSLTSLDDFKKYYVPYWIDHFFSDHRYFRIDGVAMLAIFGLGRLVKDLGGADKVKECIEYLRGELIKIGYKGLAVISNTPPCNDSVNSGMSASYAYHWGYLGFNPEHQKSSMKNQISTGRLHVVPTVSMGYNDVAWRVADRVPFISLEDFASLIKWSKDEVLSTYKDMPEEWQRKLLMFSTWNEYGEGTFISPAGLCGFGYLNEMRKAVTEEGDCYESERPTKQAYDRLGYLFPRGRKLVCTPQTVPLEQPSRVVAKIDFTSQDAIKPIFKSMTPINASAEFRNGKLCGHSTAYDPQLVFKVDFAAEDFDAICVKMRSAEETFDQSKLIDKPTTWRIFYGTEQEPELSWNKGASPSLAPETVFLSKQSAWKGQVKTLRIDPTNSEGIFEIESMTFLKSDTQKVFTYIDGNSYSSHYPSKQEDGEVYVSFEPHRDFHRFMNFYYEWDDDTQTLMTEYDSKQYFWTVDSKTVKCSDGTVITLAKPLEMYDGLPYMPMSALQKITGCKYSFDGKTLNIENK